MDTAQTLTGMIAHHGQGFREADDIYDECFEHPAIAALRSFNRRFSSRPLTHSELTLFLASMAAFNRHTIGGIAILAGRVFDQGFPPLPRAGPLIGGGVVGV